MLTNFPKGITSFGVPTMGMGGLPITPGTYYFVNSDTGSDGNDGLSMDSPKKTVAAAYAKMTDNKYDVCLLMGNAAHTLTAMLTVAKNRCIFVGLEGGSRLYGQRTRVDLNVTTAATDIGTMKNTGVGNVFMNIKFRNLNTVAQGIYSVVEAGEYGLYVNCEIYKETDLDQTGAAELVLNGDSAQFFNCTIGSLANQLSGTIIRPCVLVTAGLGGAGKVARDCYFENCLFWRNASHANNRFVYGANAADVERMMMFKNCEFVINPLSLAVPAQAIGFAASLTVGIVVAKNCGTNATKLSTTTGVFVVGPANNASAGIMTQAA